MGETRKSVVVVDDDQGMNQAMETLLKAAGFVPVMFLSAEALLHDGAARDAACLVLDVNLPGLSGFELHRRLVKSGMGLPVIFITAYDDGSSEQEAENAGAIAYFTKPFPGQEFLAAITRALASGKSGVCQ